MPKAKRPSKKRLKELCAELTVNDTLYEEFLYLKRLVAEDAERVRRGKTVIKVLYRGADGMKGIDRVLCIQERYWTPDGQIIVVGP